MESNPAEATAEPQAEIAVAVTFSSATGPVNGAVAAAGGASVPFHGWLELMDALETARAAFPHDEGPAG